MEMYKPSSEKEQAAAPPPSALNVGSVADLERRLAEAFVRAGAQVVKDVVGARGRSAVTAFSGFFGARLPGVFEEEGERRAH